MPDNIPTSILNMQSLPDGATLPNLTAEWFRVVSNVLATLQIEMVAGQRYAEIRRTETGTGWKLLIPGSTTGSGLPSNAGASKYMGVYLSADNATAEDNPDLWQVDWLRGHA